jgi:hypothetical protein
MVLRPLKRVHLVPAPPEPYAAIDATRRVRRRSIKRRVRRSQHNKRSSYNKSMSMILMLHSHHRLHNRHKAKLALRKAKA